MFVEMMKDLPVMSLEVAMEPTGTYGDPAREMFWEEGIPVYRVSPKRTHDAAEVYDGVPSSFDPKSAAIVAKLHLDGASELWPMADKKRRELKATIAIMDRYERQLQQNKNRLEGVLARHWPEVLRLFDLGTVSLWALLEQVGGPKQVARGADESRQILRRVGGHFLVEEKIEAVVASSRTTIGCRMNDWEIRALKDLACDTLRAHKEFLKAKGQVKRLGAKHPVVKAMAPEIGLVTAAVVVSEVGDPHDYPCARAYEKAAGLNLKIRSSGNHVGKCKITKRGSSTARRWLYMAVLRLIQKEPVIRCWYERKVVREGGQNKTKGIVAIMRKLIRALWHVGQGNEFDVEKLYDVRRLQVGAA